MTIDDCMRQLAEIRQNFGNLPVKTPAICAHTSGTPHEFECYYDASVEILDLGRTGTHMRMVVID